MQNTLKIEKIPSKSQFLSQINYIKTQICNISKCAHSLILWTPEMDSGDNFSIIKWCLYECALKDNIDRQNPQCAY